MTMRALLSTVPGGPETLVFGDLPVPEPGPGAVRIAVESCGINYPDALIIADRYQVRPPRPFAPGGEVAGRIDAVGPGVRGRAVGDRVAAITYLGGLAEQVCVAASRTVPVPGNTDGAEVAILLGSYATAWHALTDGLALRADRTLLVLGAGGGIGLAAVELGKALGARVIAAASTEQRLAAAGAAGADLTVRYPDTPADAAELARRFKGLAPDGVDAVVDPVGGWLAEPALWSLAPGGRYAVIGFAGGIPAIPLNLILLKRCAVVGVLYDAFAKADPAAADAEIAELLALHRAGRIAPRIGADYPFARAAEAIADLAARRVIGKAVVRIG